MIDQLWDVIIPAKNAASTVAAVVISARSAIGAREVIVLDDGSVDDTARAARQAGAIVVTAGGGSVGIDAAQVVAASRAQTFVFFAADVVGALPEHFEALAHPVVRDEFAMVVGVVGVLGENALLRLPSLSPFRGMRRDVFEGIPQAKRQFPMTAMTNHVVVRRGARVGARLLSGCAYASGASHQPGRLRQLTSIPLWSYPRYLRRVELLPSTPDRSGDVRSKEKP